MEIAKKIWITFFTTSSKSYPHFFSFTSSKLFIKINSSGLEPFVFSFHQQENKLSDSYTITQIRDLYSYPLKNYLKERGLTKTVWKYVKEIKFTLNQKKLFAIGFQNDSGGWELRNSFYKGSFLKKDITTGLQFKSDTINVFEGFMDFLSFEELFPENRECYLVLNSISMVEKSKQILQNFEHINLYLDNDQAGRKMTLQLKNEFSQAQNKSDLYQGFKRKTEEKRIFRFKASAVLKVERCVCPYKTFGLALQQTLSRSFLRSEILKIEQ